MTDRSKFEQMLEHLINEEQDKAKELFHQLVVEKSREIYENILSEDFDEEDKEDDDDDDVKENSEITEQPFGGDETDDFISDVEENPVHSFDAEMDTDHDSEDEFSLGGEETDKEEVLDAVEKLEDLLQRFLDAEEGEEEHDMPFDSDEEDKDLEDEDEDEGDMKEEGLEESVKLTPVAAAKHGDDGANTKSPVASKNDMGGTAKNITGGDEETKSGTKGGLASPDVKDMKTGNVNVVGNKKAPKLQSVSKPKHGDAGDKSADSPINGAPKRAK